MKEHHQEPLDPKIDEAKTEWHSNQCYIDRILEVRSFNGKTSSLAALIIRKRFKKWVDGCGYRSERCQVLTHPPTH